MKKKLLFVFMYIISLIIFPALAASQEDTIDPIDDLNGGRVATVLEGDPAPFDGTLLDEYAVATILAKEEIQEKMCESKLNEQKDKQEVKCNYEKMLIQSEIEYQQNSFDIQLKAKEADIKILEEAFKDQTDNTFWWMVGGIGGGLIVGSFTTILVYEVAN